MIYGDTLERIREELKQKKNDLTEELRILPEGMLLCTDEGIARKYYQRLPAAGNRKKERRFGVKKRPEIRDGLVRKKYITEALGIIDSDIAVIDSACRSYVPADELSVMAGFIEKYPDLRAGIYKTPINEEAWKNAVGSIDNYHPESLRQTSADGNRRRSKNEIYIASRLDHYGLIYRADCPTGIPGLKWAPDFAILRKRDRKIVYWEHFGMMTDSGYRAHAREKLRDYERAGIVPWDNLIITYDTNGGDMRADLIEAMIKCWLL